MSEVKEPNFENMNDIMIDIETMSTLPNAAICSIGAVKFDRFSEDLRLNRETFYRRVDMKSCEDLGLDFDKNTKKWWREQGENASKEIFTDDNRHPLQIVLQDLKEFIGDKKDTIKIWSQGPLFDIVILENAYRKCGIEIPWKFWNCRDTRTVYDVAKMRYRNNSNAHHALSDCQVQILFLQSALRILQ